MNPIIILLPGYLTPCALTPEIVRRECEAWGLTIGTMSFHTIGPGQPQAHGRLARRREAGLGTPKENAPSSQA